VKADDDDSIAATIIPMLETTVNLHNNSVATLLDTAKALGYLTLSTPNHKKHVHK